MGAAAVLAAVVDWAALGQVIWVSLVAGVAVTAIFSVALLGGTRAGEARRASRGGAPSGYGALAALAALAFVGGIAWAVHLILTG